MKKKIWTAALAGGMALSAVAQTPITLVNPDFEEPGTVKISSDWGQVPGWNADALPSDSGVETGWTTSGTWSGYLRNGDPAIWQLTSHAIGAGDVFTLEFLSRNNWSQGSGGTQVPGMLEAILYYDNAGARVPFATTTAVTDNATGVAEEFTLPAAAVPPEAVGQLLGVQFQNITDTGSGGGPGGSWLLVDNVRLSIVPEPSVLALCLGGLGSLVFFKRRRG